MIEESTNFLKIFDESTSLLSEGNGEKKVNIKGDDFEVYLSFDNNGFLEDFWVYESGKEQGTPKASAHYDKAGNLISKHSFTYDEKNNMTENVQYNHENALIGRSVYENDENGRLIIAHCFDNEGNLEYTFEHEWEGDTWNVISTIYRNVNGNQIQEPVDNPEV